MVDIPESIQPCNMKNRDIYWKRHMIQETLYIDNVTSVPFKVGTLGPHTVLPVTISCPIVFSWISLAAWNLVPVKGDFSFKKPEVAGHQIWAMGALSHLSDLMFHQKHCMRRDAWEGTLSSWDCQSPVAHSCGLLNHPNSFHRGMFKRNAKFNADSLLYLFSHFEWDGHTVHSMASTAPTD